MVNVPGLTAKAMASPDGVDAVMTNPGEDASTQMGLTWHSLQSTCTLEVTTANDRYFSNATKLELEGTIGTVESYIDLGEVALYTYHPVLTDLTPGTNYIYRIVTAEDESQTYSFKTASGATTFNFGWMSDVHADNREPGKMNNMNSMLNNMKSVLGGEMDLILFSGDLVKYGNYYAAWQQWDNNYVARNYVFAPVPGNKEYYKATNIASDTKTKRYSGEWYNDNTNTPNNGIAGVDGTYWFIYNNVMFVGINNVQENGETDFILPAQQEWFKQIVAANKDNYDYLVVQTHYPYFIHSENGDGKDAPCSWGSYEDWYQIFDECGVDFALSGDYHEYCRTNRIYNDAVATSNSQGTVYITNGQVPESAYNGSVTESSDPRVATYIGGSTLDAGVFSVSESGMTFTLVGPNGNVIDTVTVPNKKSSGSDIPVDPVDPEPVESKKVIEYFGNWHGTKVEDLPWGSFTDLNYSFWHVVPDTSVEGVSGKTTFEAKADGDEARTAFKIDTMSAEYDFGPDGYMAQFAAAGEAHPDVNLILSLGGWSGCGWFSEMASTEAGRKSFAASCVQTILDNPWIDGIDIDWEHPGGAGGETRDPEGEGDEGCPIWTTAEDDKANFTLMLAELRAALDAEFGEGTKLLTACCSASTGWTLPHQDWASASQYLDSINIMSYDMWGNWEGTAGHQTALTWVKNAVAYMNERGIPSSKLNAGVAIYSHSFKITQNAALNSLVGAAAYEDNSQFEQYPAKDYAKFEAQAVADGEKGWHKYFDTEASAAYLYNDDPSSPYYKVFLSMDNDESLYYKLGYVQDAGLQGVIVWEINHDTADFRYTKQMGRAMIDGVYGGLDKKPTVNDPTKGGTTPEVPVDPSKKVATDNKDSIMAIPEGNTPEKKEYSIYTADALKYFADLVNNGTDFAGITIKLAADIDLNPGVTILDENLEVNADVDVNSLYQFPGIGRVDSANGRNIEFKGTFDGQNHVIKGLYMYNETSPCGRGMTGFFNLCEFATIKNLGFVDSLVVSTTKMTGTIVGNTGYDVGSGSDSLRIENCFVVGQVDCSTPATDYNWNGGLVGFMGGSKQATTSMEYCYADVLLKSGSTKPKNGMLVGQNYASIGNCYIVGRGFEAPNATQEIANIAEGRKGQTHTGMIYAAKGLINAPNYEGEIEVDSSYVTFLDDRAAVVEKIKTDRADDAAAAAFLAVIAGEATLNTYDSESPVTAELGAMVDTGETEFDTTRTMFTVGDTSGTANVLNVAIGTPEVTDHGYKIDSLEGFLHFAELVNTGTSFANKKVTLGCDIDLNAGIDILDANHNLLVDPDSDSIYKFPGIGWYDSENKKAYAFDGTFDGNGYVIKGLVMTEATCKNGKAMGLFNLLNKATLDNVGVTDSYIRNKNTGYTGGLVGDMGYSVKSDVPAMASDKVLLNNCFFVGQVDCSANSGQYVGGLVGFCGTGSSSTESVIDGCYADAVVKSGATKRGAILVGQNYATVNDCYVTGGKLVMPNGSSASEIGALQGRKGVYGEDPSYIAAGLVESPAFNEDATANLVVTTAEEVKALCRNKTFLACAEGSYLVGRGIPTYVENTVSYSHNYYITVRKTFVEYTFDSLPKVTEGATPEDDWYFGSDSYPAFYNFRIETDPTDASNNVMAVTANPARCQLLLEYAVAELPKNATVSFRFYIPEGSAVGSGVDWHGIVEDALQEVESTTPSANFDQVLYIKAAQDSGSLINTTEFRQGEWVEISCSLNDFTDGNIIINFWKSIYGSQELVDSVTTCSTLLIDDFKIVGEADPAKAVDQPDEKWEPEMQRPAKDGGYDYTWTVSEDGIKGLPAVVTDGSATNVTEELKAALEYATSTEGFFKPARNVIVIIGDGMGIDPVTASENWAGELIMNKLPNQSASMTKSYTSSYASKWTGNWSKDVTVTKALTVTDSAAGGSAIASGYKTYYYSIATNTDGSKLRSLADVKKDQGGKIGDITNGWISDATPAVFTAQSVKRGLDDDEAGMAMFGQKYLQAQMYAYACDVLIGYAGEDEVIEMCFKNEPEYAQATDQDYYTNWSKAVADDGKVTFLTRSAFGYDVETDVKNDAFGGTITDQAAYEEQLDNTPSMTQVTAYALKKLQEESDENGFFVMIEDGETDMDGHNNNLRGQINEVQNLDEAVAIALKFVLENPDTILLITADHDTGGMSLKDGWQDYLKKCAYSTSGHSANNVPVYAIGYGTEVFNGQMMQNNYTGRILGNLMGETGFGDSENDPLLILDGGAHGANLVAAVVDTNRQIGTSSASVLETYNVLTTEEKEARIAANAAIIAMPLTVSTLESAIVTVGDKIEVPADPYCTDEGFEFTGWYKDAECTVLWDFNNDTVAEHGDTVLYAGWKAATVVPEVPALTEEKEAAAKTLDAEAPASLVDVKDRMVQAAIDEAKAAVNAAESTEAIAEAVSAAQAQIAGVKDGSALKSRWIEFQGKSYYFDAKAKTYKNRYKIVSGVGYTFDADGALATGGWTRYAKGDRYYWAGAYVTGWNEVEGATRYFDANGYMAKGLTKIDGEFYLFTEDGAYVGREADYTGFYVTKTGTYYYDLGVQVTGWKLLDGKYYWFNPADGGRMRTQDKIVSGVYYRINADGSSDGLGVIVSKKGVKGFRAGEQIHNESLFINGVYYTFGSENWTKQ